VGTVLSTAPICLSSNLIFLSRSRASSSSSLRKRKSAAAATVDTVHAPARHVSAAVVVEEHVHGCVLVAALSVFVVLLCKNTSARKIRGATLAFVSLFLSLTSASCCSCALKSHTGMPRGLLGTTPSMRLSNRGGD
jgi:hypothetical protein